MPNTSAALALLYRSYLVTSYIFEEAPKFEPS